MMTNKNADKDDNNIALSDDNSKIICENAYHQRTENALPTASVVLPLLIGLAHRSSSATSRALVMAALREYEATQRICKWISQQEKILKIMKKNMEDPKKEKREKPPHIHWLFQSLLSPSIRVRRAAARILLDGSDPRRNSSLKRTTISPPRIVLRDALLSLIQMDLNSFYYNPKESIQQSDDRQVYVFNHHSNLNNITRSDGDYMIQLFGMLSHVICDDDNLSTSFNDVLSVEGTDSTSASSTENSVRSRLSSSLAIEAFLAAGGLRWVTRNILLLATLLLRDSCCFRGRTSGQTRYFTALAQDELYLEAIQTRLLLLVDLSYRLLLFSSISSEKNLMADALSDTKKPSRASKLSEKKNMSQSTDQNSKKQSEYQSHTAKRTIDRTAVPAVKSAEETLKEERHRTLVKAQGLLWNPTRYLAAISLVAPKSPFLADENNLNSNYFYQSTKTPLSTAPKRIYSNSSLSVLSIDQHQMDGDNGNNVHAIPQISLSPLACLIIAREILKSGTTNSTHSSSSHSPPSSFQAAHSILPGVSSTNKNTSIVSSTHNPMEVSDYPFPNRINGMDKCAEILGKLVNPGSQPLVIRESTILASKKSKEGLKSSNNSRKNKSTKSSLKRKRNALRSLGKSPRGGGSKRKRRRQKPFSNQQQHISTDSIANFLFGRDTAMRMGSNSRSSTAGKNSKSMVVDALTSVLDQHGISSNFRNDQDEEEDDENDDENDHDDDEEDDDNHEVNDEEVDIEKIEGEEHGEEESKGYGEEGEVDENDDRQEEEKEESAGVDDRENEDDDHNNGDDEDDEDDEEEGMVCEMEEEGTKILPEDDEEIDSDEADDRSSHHTSEKHRSNVISNMNNGIVQDVVMADDDDDDDDDEDGDDDDDDDDDDEGDEGDEGDILGAPVVGQFDDAILVVDEVDDGDNDNDNDDDDEADHNDLHAIRSRNSVNSRQRGLHNHSMKNDESVSLKASDERKKIYLGACMEILKAQYTSLHQYHHHDTQATQYQSEHHHILNVATHPRKSLLIAPRARLNTACTPLNHGVDVSVVSPPLLTPPAEQSLIRSMCDIVKPPKKPLNLKIFMRRAPTQEEFFRGSLSRNPVSLSSLKASGGSGTSDGDTEPRVRDLRQQIANDLQMSDSAELLELLVADKILDMDLKLRVVFQVLWKKHLMENATTTSSGSTLLPGVLSGQHIISGGSGLSMVFSTISERGVSRRSNLNENTPLSSLPPMIVTYRLAGVDGEATEDKVEVSDLTDPDEPPDTNTSLSEYEVRMEKEYSSTRIVSDGRGISVLLRSAESHLNDVLRRIRRDDVGRSYTNDSVQVMRKNHVRDTFLKSPACPSLVLLRHCARLTNNRKKMLRARAPTILLRMLLNVLNCIDDSCQLNAKNSVSGSSSNVSAKNNSNETAVSEVTSTENQQAKRLKTNGSIGNNPTADALQDLIETLASDISASVSKCRKSEEDSDAVVSSELFNEDKAHESDSPEYGESTLPMLLSSLRSTSLSPPLRKVIAKLLPFLTYGQLEQSRALASNFLRHISVEALNNESGEDSDKTANDNRDHVLMETFIDSAINLPPVSVCHTLRMELMHQGFLERIRSFIFLNAPKEPPSWSPALGPKVTSGNNQNVKQKKDANVMSWQNYYRRNGLHTAFRILIGLSADHNVTQCFLADVSDKLHHKESMNTATNSDYSFIIFIHWIESTSDNVVLGVNTRGLGLLAETLLDGLSENNTLVQEKISCLRRKTRNRKKEIAEERRNKALVGMSSFGSLVGPSSFETKIPGKNIESGNEPSLGTLAFDVESLPLGIDESMHVSSNKEASASVSNIKQQENLSSQILEESNKNMKNITNEKSHEVKPAWMLEMEAMEDEDGLTCAICQEGRTLQPTELLGLYAYVKKVSIPSNRAGGRGNIDGTVMLLSLPQTLPASLIDSIADKKWFQPAKSAAAAIQSSPNAMAAIPVSSSPSSSSSGRSSNFIITVTAGNAIHCTCHSKARAADRNHPKAPKSEWEGASLRNSRVTCNVIFPLVSSKSSNVPLMAVEKALSDYQNVISNTLGSRPKSMLWTVLHDVRLLLLRMCYGESLNSDCGGGSLSSNLLLLFYSFQMADMLSDDAEHDASETVQHARELSAGYLVALEILRAKDFPKDNAASRRLQRSIADAAPMASICCILYDNETDNIVKSNDKLFKEKCITNVKDPSSKRRWENYKNHFLCGLLRCAGRRYALGLHDSGCTQSHNSNFNRQIRSGSFNEWDLSEIGNEDFSKASSKTSSRGGNQSGITNDNYKKSLFPFITFFALIDQFSAEFTLSMNDKMIEESCGRVLHVVESCQRCDDIQSLLLKAKITVDDDKIKEEFEYGIQSY